MSALALFGEDPPAEPVPVAVKHTERSVLECLRRRYIERHGNGERWAFATHVRASAGFGEWGNPMRTADAIAMDLWPSKGLEIHGHEVKVSRSDWLTELKNPRKCEPVKRYCDRWWLVVSDRSIVKTGELPYDWGLLVVTGDTVRVARQAPRLKPEPVNRDFNGAAAARGGQDRTEANPMTGQNQTAINAAAARWLTDHLDRWGLTDPANRADFVCRELLTLGLAPVPKPYPRPPRQAGQRRRPCTSRSDTKRKPQRRPSRHEHP